MMKFTPKLNNVAAFLIAGLLLAMSGNAQADPKDLPVVTSAELNANEGTILITGKNFTDKDDFSGSVELYLAETGTNQLTVDSFTDLEPTDQAPEALQQILVSGLPENIDEFTGTHLLVIRKETKGKKKSKKFETATYPIALNTTNSDGSKGPKGDPGEAGPAGPKGDPGEAGPAGQDGQAGAEGPAGADGAQGPAGNSVLSGAGVPNDADGLDGDTYLDQTTGDLYQKIASFWILTGDNLKGPAGADGAQGETGPAGPQGLTGAQGPQGEQGPEGPQGPAGTDGTNGTNGIDGTNGTNGTDGSTGPKGDTGTGIASGAFNANGELILTLTDGTQINVGTIPDTPDALKPYTDFFNMEFVTVNDTNNVDDDTGYGAVPYSYRIGKYEVSRAMIDAYNANSGGPTITLADLTAYGGNEPNKPATGMSWNEAARFVNWLNTSQGYQAAYKFNTDGSNDNIVLWTPAEAWQQGGENLYRHKDAYYFLPSEDEWYKAAYYNSSINSYYNYATGSDDTPTAVTSGTDFGTAVYFNGVTSSPGPADITNAGGLSPYGTMAQNGNVWEWSESAFDGVNDTNSEIRVRRGCGWGGTSNFMLSSNRLNPNPYDNYVTNGFRVASVDDPLDIEFVDIGNAGNAADATGYGAVGYKYAIGKYEITADQWASVTGYDSLIENTSNEAWNGNQPTANATWYEAAKFANWLTSGNTLQGAYQFSDANTFTGVDRQAALATYGTIYVIPSEDEWYKAAYLKGDGSGYTSYSTGDTLPVAGVDANWGAARSAPWDVGSGSVENNGTFDMGGNVLEWNESAFDGSLDQPDENRVRRGGSWLGLAAGQLSSNRISDFPANENASFGFRVARISEGPKSWQQLGADIDGEAAVDYSGWGVSLSANGNIAAIGAYFNDGNGTDSGHVRVFQYVGSSWQQLGSDIDGEAAQDRSGRNDSVSLSADGSIVAIGSSRNTRNGFDSGHVRVYQYDGTNWQQVGSDIDGEAAYNSFGCSVSLTPDGSIMAIGARQNDGNGTDSGHVRVYQYDGTDWQQLGSDIDGEAAGDEFGVSAALSADGNIVAIGAWKNDGINGADSGHVRVFKYDGANWQQLGDDIDGEAAGDASGLRVSLSADGNIVAVGAWQNDGNGTDSGHVRVFQYDGASWQQLGSDIDGEAAGDRAGFPVEISPNGNIMAIGARFNDGNGTDSGHMRIYQYDGASWQQLGSDIDGEAAGDWSGCEVSLSFDGNIVAIGAKLNDGINGTDSGHVRVYQLTP